MTSSSSLPASDIVLSLHQVEKRYTQPSDMVDRVGRLLRGRTQPRSVLAVANVDLDIHRGEVIGVVGESGCGKSTLGRVIAGIFPATRGQVRYEGQAIDAMTSVQRHAYELGVQMIFQDPYASLNPRMRVLDIIGEAPRVHGLVSRQDQEAYVCDLMSRVGLDPAYRFRYPHQFSGGQRQRIGVARALALKPSVIVCDEAVAALDVSVQAQVLNLFIELRKEFNLTYFFISHNLGVVSHLSDRVAIMYLGRIVEIAPAETIFTHANHPYTQALIKELPRLSAEHRQFEPIKGELPSPLDPPPGCPFHPRCPHAMPRCREALPVLKDIGLREGVSGGDRAVHLSACHLND
ncbi:MAG TPA: oligopeptide/dipeptide ABC transporter ATP-binding protein [Burkholderiaceae bacterium]|nr:oligopeptide/dipeptide ABC transporter ATP-binding protein [Burkholderiaceae bacterium]